MLDMLTSDPLEINASVAMSDAERAAHQAQIERACSQACQAIAPAWQKKMESTE